jgi:hypothetical protein
LAWVGGSGSSRTSSIRTGRRSTTGSPRRSSSGTGRRKGGPRPPGLEPETQQALPHHKGSSPPPLRRGYAAPDFEAAGAKARAGSNLKGKRLSVYSLGMGCAGLSGAGGSL